MTAGYRRVMNMAAREYAAERYSNDDMQQVIADAFRAGVAWEQESDNE